MGLRVTWALGDTARLGRSLAAIGLRVRRGARRAPRLLLIHALMFPIALFILIPFLWMLKTSFEHPEDIFQTVPHWLPLSPTLENYAEVLASPLVGFGPSLRNSVIVSGGTTLISVALTAMAGYALSRFHFRGKLVFTLYLIMSQMIPGTLILMATYLIIAWLKLLNTYWGLLLAFSALSVPFSTWLLKGYFDTVPLELEEQAMIDGCTRLQSLLRIVLPLALPGLAAVSIFIFLEAWNEFMMALTIVTQDELRPLSVKLVTFIGFYRTEWGPAMAYSVVITLPVILLFAVLQRVMVGGLTAGFSK